MSHAAGFRFSRIDAIVIVACAFLTGFAWKALGSLTLGNLWNEDPKALRSQGLPKGYCGFCDTETTRGRSTPSRVDYA